MEFDQIGIPAPAKRDGMRLLEPKRLWLTSMEGRRTLAESFDGFREVRVSFIEVDGAPIEFVQPY